MDPAKSAGWNDPPLFSYTESLEHTKSHKRSSLNKRIAYPMNSAEVSRLSSADPTTATTFDPNLPPPPVGILVKSNLDPPSEAKNKIDMETAKSDIFNDTEMLVKVMKNVDEFMSLKKNLLQVHNKEEQIRRKLRIMEESWEAKFPVDIKIKVLQLSEALKDENMKLGNEIQASLMIDYPKICGEFIPAFRQLINVQQQ